jgi:cell wall-associated NlpC family hydrolase
MTGTPSRDLASEDLWRSSQERAQRRRAAARHRRNVKRISVPLGVTADEPPATTLDDEPCADHTLGSEAVAIAERHLGAPHRFGGCDPSGFDCSGLVVHVYAELEVALPHFAAAQFHEGRHIGLDELHRGDLVFFDGLDHVGIYAGGGRFIHAPQTGDHVLVSSLTSGWYADHCDGAVRIG